MVVVGWLCIHRRVGDSLPRNTSEALAVSSPTTVPGRQIRSHAPLYESNGNMMVMRVQCLNESHVAVRDLCRCRS